MTFIVVSGGTLPHIGAVVIASYEEGEVKIISYGFPHHKEEELFIELAKSLVQYLREKDSCFKLVFILIMLRKNK
ncbi:hypothetical protein KHA80_18055 [Anaerobacillus sp. HL2]|nr:hypothetical protein KHA80_18055 [Anaerobacillus sp. HL2]